jgi:hypothetical protein
MRLLHFIRSWSIRIELCSEFLTLRISHGSSTVFRSMILLASARSEPRSTQENHSTRLHYIQKQYGEQRCDASSSNSWAFLSSFTGGAVYAMREPTSQKPQNVIKVEQVTHDRYYHVTRQRKRKHTSQTEVCLNKNIRGRSSPAPDTKSNYIVQKCFLLLFHVNKN